MIMTHKPFSQACENNKDPILQVISTVFCQPIIVWEIGSGTGQHACYFARYLPHVEWQPTDRSENIPGICLWQEEAQLANLKPPLTLDVTVDGTHSFSRGQYFWAISVALEIDQELMIGAVYAPALNDYYCAEKGRGAWKNGLPITVSSETNLADGMVATGFACLRSYLEDNNLQRFGRIAQNTTGQRRFGSAALDLCLVADGQVDAFWEQELNLYDVAAGALIAQEAGATVTDFQGNEGLFPKQVLVTNGKILSQILPLM